MPRYLPEPPYQHGTAGHTAVVLVNLGTPDAPDAPSLRRYLKQFLSDPRVVEIPRLVWWPILNGIILNTRPKKSAAKYASIWMNEGSPLRVHTERQAQLLAKSFAQRSVPVRVEWAMRYGTPSIPDTLSRLKAQGAERILLLPLYPQYAASTGATVVDEAARWLLQTRNQPELRFIKHFHDHPGYISALANSIRAHWDNHGQLGPRDKLLLSFHGLPKRSLDLGDPYFCECQKTGRLVAEQLGLQQGQYQVCFQSRFGKAEWLQPYTAPTLATWAREGIERVDVICPGFVADCLETLEEIALEGRDDFIAAGGKAYHYIPALNESPDWIDTLHAITVQALAGWLEQAQPDQTALADSARRASALGRNK
ncbi:ferrochelatase [Dechloromonas sp. ZY10]|uniref:ferrochelatase n=1 Tax=Dechloromonas aquae TaxID=2664436 RepID=UPI003527DAE9